MASKASASSETPLLDDALRACCRRRHWSQTGESGVEIVHRTLRRRHAVQECLLVGEPFVDREEVGMNAGDIETKAGLASSIR